MSQHLQRQWAIAAFYEAIVEHLSGFPKLAEHVAELKKAGIHLHQIQLVLGVEVDDAGSSAADCSDEQFLRSLRIDPDIAAPGHAPNSEGGS